MKSIQKSTTATKVTGASSKDDARMSTKALLSLIAKNLPELSQSLPKSAAALHQGLRAAQAGGVDIPGVQTPVLSNAKLNKLLTPELKALMNRAGVEARHDRLVGNDGSRAIEIPWLEMNKPSMGKAKYADRPNLLLSQSQVWGSHHIDRNLSGQELEKLGAGIEQIRQAALSAETKRTASVEKKREKAAKAAQTKNPTEVKYAKPVDNGPGSEIWKDGQRLAKQERDRAYAAANARRSDGSYYNTSTDEAFRKEWARRRDMGE